MKSLLSLVGVLFCLACLAATPALADDPCAGDARRFCPDVKAGSGRLVSCLQAN
jgi:hypothetical protein